jgi:hypothetical protein
MNPGRLVVAVLAVFLAYLGTDFLIHEVWLKPDYRATASLWRTEADMQSHFVWLLLAHLLWAAMFVALWARGFAAHNCLLCASIYGLFMGMLCESRTLIWYVVQPLPGILAAKWFVVGAAQGVFLGLITFFAYKPKPEAVPPTG